MLYVELWVRGNCLPAYMDMDMDMGHDQKHNACACLCPSQLRGRSSVVAVAHMSEDVLEADVVSVDPSTCTLPCLAGALTPKLLHMLSCCDQALPVADPGQALIYASTQGDSDAITAQLAELTERLVTELSTDPAGPDAQATAAMLQYSLHTSLICASARGHIEVVKALIAARANVDERTNARVELRAVSAHHLTSHAHTASAPCDTLYVPRACVPMRRIPTVCVHGGRPPAEGYVAII